MQEITKIVVPLDLGTHTQKLVDFALYMAKKLSAHISFIHVVEFYATNNLAPISSLEKINQERMERTTEIMTRLIEDNKEGYPNISGMIRQGEAVESIVKYAEEEQAGLLIIGTHGSKGLERILLGSVARRVLKKVHCPSLLMNPYK
jgi:nucleotide-binding universal stress UspA family protein